MMKQNVVDQDRRRFWWLLGLLLLLIMIRYSFQTDIPRIVFLAVIGLTVLLGDRDEIIAMLMCCIPLHESIDFFYALVICTLVYICKQFRQIRLGTSLMLVILIVVWELLHCFRPSFSVVNFLSNIIPFLVLAVIMASDLRNLDYAFVVRAMAWTTLGITMVLLVRVLYFADFNIPLALAGLQRLGLDQHSSIEDATIQGGQIHPNTLGIVTVLASTGLMQLRSMGVGKKGDMMLMCAMLAFAALSTSRTYLACLALMIVLLILSEKGGSVKKLRLIGALCLAVAAATGVMALLFPDTFAYFVSRFSVADITTGRDDLMVRYHHFIVDNPKVMLFGIGLQDFGNRLVEFYRVAAGVPHNALQELIIAWGFPGVLLFLALFFSMFRVSYQQNSRQSLINWIPLLIILFKSLAGQMLNSYYTMLAFSFAFLSLCIDMGQDFRKYPPVQ